MESSRREWAIASRDDPGFVKPAVRLGPRPQVRILMYNQGYKVAGPLALEHYPASARTIGAHLRTTRFAPFTSEWRAAAQSTTPAPAR